MNKIFNVCRHSLMKKFNLLTIKSRNYDQIIDIKTPSDSSMDLMRSRLIYQSRKRGILENCIIFTSFADKYLNTFDRAQLQKYDALINSEHDEWDLYAWTIGSKSPPQEFDNDVMSLLQNHIKKQNHNSK
ncbi:Succinate dehydrogenase assembly factor 2, mitochondrial,Flavinator of succinate dehydrogenase [Cinara cedri]|uniref:Succinate dehydrogenase assembly factor 2, mitochondrial n=1 Tax=Cinara cedri TaxID=506608 RepID=A0A5E4M7Y3_9HEMI|nr:Succinate dehydrogenase assembly factor 2, mitochondrial,Flavinator of succinate dehydrogenase [Cinara cedri]